MFREGIDGITEIVDVCPDCLTPLQVGDWPLGCHGSRDHSISKRDALIHSSEKLCVFQAPDGSYSIPPSNQHPMHPKLVAAGYQRVIIDNVSGVKDVEKKTGTISERMNYDAGSGLAEREQLKHISAPPKPIPDIL